MSIPDPNNYGAFNLPLMDPRDPLNAEVYRRIQQKAAEKAIGGQSMQHISGVLQSIIQRGLGQ